jgi:addiction module RelE/StbE family toxin
MPKKYRVKWTKSAKDDILNIISYIKKDSPSIAKAVYTKIKEQANLSNFFPLKGRIVPELEKEGITTYREIVTPPWRIIYTIGSDTIYIIAILDSRQNIEEILIQKIIKGQI